MDPNTDSQGTLDMSWSTFVEDGFNPTCLGLTFKGEDETGAWEVRVREGNGRYAYTAEYNFTEKAVREDEDEDTNLTLWGDTHAGSLAKIVEKLNDLEYRVWEMREEVEK